MWPKFLKHFVLTALTGLLASAAAVALIDPLAISPLRILSDEVLPQTNRRYLVPAIVRSHRYDSYVVGTSTIHSLDPKRLEAVLAGRFANLSLFASTPYEQTRVVQLITREGPPAHTIVWGLDLTWCNASPPSHTSGLSEFPDWLYDEDGWNDFANALNWGTLDLARRKLEQLLRPKGERLRADGYANMLPPDDTYDLGKAQGKLYGAAPRRKLVAIAAPRQGASSQAGAQLPGVLILQGALAQIAHSVQLIFVLMPVHAILLPAPGSHEVKLKDDCKAAIAALAERHGAWLLDAMWHSTWTVDDRNFWDSWHFREHLAQALVAGIDAAVNRDRSEPESALRILVRGR